MWSALFNKQNPQCPEKEVKEVKEHIHEAQVQFSAPHALRSTSIIKYSPSKTPEITLESPPPQHSWGAALIIKIH